MCEFKKRAQGLCNTWRKACWVDSTRLQCQTDILDEFERERFYDSPLD